MSYIVIKSTPSDDGWVHEPVMWTINAIEAYGYEENQQNEHDGREDGIMMNVIETDLNSSVDLIEDGEYMVCIDGLCYIDESKLDL